MNSTESTVEKSRLACPGSVRPRSGSVRLWCIFLVANDFLRRVYILDMNQADRLGFFVTFFVALRMIFRFCFDSRKSTM